MIANSKIAQAMLDAALAEFDVMPSPGSDGYNGDVVFKRLIRLHHRISKMHDEHRKTLTDDEVDYTSPLHVIATAMWANLIGYEDDQTLGAECDGALQILAFANLVRALGLASSLEMVVQDFDGGFLEGPHEPIMSLLRDEKEEKDASP